MPVDAMLVIKPRAQGGGIFDVIAKAANSALAKKVITAATNSTLAKKVVNSGIAKKVIDSGVGKTVAKNITKENFIKAANSAIGKQLQKAVVTGVSNAAEKAATTGLQKLGFPAPSNVKPTPDWTVSPNPPTLPPQIAIQSQPPNPRKSKVGSKRPRPPGISESGRKKGKRRRIGKGIILE